MIRSIDLCKNFRGIESSLSEVLFSKEKNKKKKNRMGTLSSKSYM
jgi:hypothetical protein